MLGCRLVLLGPWLMVLAYASSMPVLSACLAQQQARGVQHIVLLLCCL